MNFTKYLWSICCLSIISLSLVSCYEDKKDSSDDLKEILTEKPYLDKEDTTPTKEDTTSTLTDNDTYFPNDLEDRYNKSNKSDWEVPSFSGTNKKIYLDLKNNLIIKISRSPVEYDNEKKVYLKLAKEHPDLVAKTICDDTNRCFIQDYKEENKTLEYYTNLNKPSQSSPKVYFTFEQIIFLDNYYDAAFRSNFYSPLDVFHGTRLVDFIKVIENGKEVYKLIDFDLRFNNTTVHDLNEIHSVEELIKSINKRQI